MARDTSGTFQINDIVLDIPPTAISIKRTSFNNYWNTLRTRSSMKTRSGFSSLDINISMVFTDETALLPDNPGVNSLSKLRRIISQVRVTPFCWVDNEFLRDSVLGGGVDQAMVLALKHIELFTSGDSPNTVHVEAQFVWFNYFPYLKNYLFREDIFTPKSVENPKDSRAWRLLWTAEQMRNKYAQAPVQLGEKPTIFQALQFALFPKQSYLQAKSMFNAMVAMEDSLLEKTEHIQTLQASEFSGGVPDILVDVIKDAFSKSEHKKNETNAISFGRELLSEITSTTVMLDDVVAEDNMSEEDYPKTLDTQGWNIHDLLDVITKRKTGYKEFVERYSWAQDDSQWKEVILNNGKSVQISPSFSRTTKESKKDNSMSGSVLMSRVQKLYTSNPISKDRSGADLVLSSLSISFDNILATLPVIGHPYPTYQHIGSVDATIVLSLHAIGSKSVQDVSNFYTLVEDQIRKYRQIPACYHNIMVDNDLLSMCGLREFISEGVNISTIPGSPDSYSITLELVDASIKTGTREMLVPGQNFSTRSEVRAELMKIINRYVKSQLSSLSKIGKLGHVLSGGLRADGGGPGVRRLDRSITSIYQIINLNNKENLYLYNAVDEYKKELDKLVTHYIYTYGKEEEYFSGIFAITNEEIPGIEKVQEDLRLFMRINEKKPDPDRSGKTEETDRSSSSTLVDATLGHIRYHIVSSRDKESRINQLIKKRFLDSADLVAAYDLLEEMKSSLSSSPDDMKIISEYQSAIARSSALKKEIFDRQMLQFAAFVQGFADRILQSSILLLPEFKPIREMQKIPSIGSAADTYPDFPIREVVKLLEQNKEVYNTILSNLNDALFLEDLGVKGLGISSLINPDFYIYPGNEDGQLDAIPYLVINKAKDLIKAGKESREKLEDNYYNKAYKAIIGTERANGIQKSREASYVSSEKGLKKTIQQLEAVPPGDPNRLYADRALVGLREKLASISRPLETTDGYTKIGPLINDANQTYPITLNFIKQGISDLFSNIENPVTAYSQTGQDIANVFNITTYQRPASETRLKPTEYGSAVKHNPLSDCSQLEFQSDDYYQPDFLWDKDPNTQPRFFIPVIPAAERQYTSRFSDVRSFSKKPHIGLDIAHRTSSLTTSMTVVAAADGEISHIQGLEPKDGQWSFQLRNGTVKQKDKETTVSVTVSHSGGFSTVYKHMQWDAFMQDLHDKLYGEGQYQGQGHQKIEVVGGQTKLGMVGDTGYSTGPHLHFEVRYYGTPIDPEEILEGKGSKSKGPPGWISPNSESLFTRSVEQFQKEMYSSQGISLMRAFPTYKLYFIESDMNERRRFGFDDFFSYSAVQAITVIRSRKIPADLCVIRLTNLSGVLTNKKFGEIEGALNENGQLATENGRKAHKTNTIFENSIASILLQPGVQMQLRLGYSNNPDELEKLFNGVIVDVTYLNDSEMLEITCQSYGIELIQNTYGDVKKFGSWFSDKAQRTSSILEELLAAPEIVHFGRWEAGAGQSFNVGSDRTDIGNTAYGLLSTRFKWNPQPQDDNIFAPPPGLLGAAEYEKPYKMFRTTAWDVFQEMTLRHPGYVAMPVPYQDHWGPRMTMFFGLPDQFYFARDPSPKEKEMMANISSLVNSAQDAWKAHKPTSEDKLQDPDVDDEELDLLIDGAKVWPKKISGSTKELININTRAYLTRFASDRGFIKPFRSYHLLTSSSHIIQNNIESGLTNTFNVVTLEYEDDEPSSPDTATGELKWDDISTFTMNAEAGIPDEEKREMMAQYHNCVGYEMAKRYCIGLLAESLRHGYKGHMLVIGNPAIKPCDVCYVIDEFTDMFGPFEVEQVVHNFSQDSGFTTEITPNMCIHPNEMSTMTTTDGMGLIAEHWLRQSGVPGLPSIIAACSNREESSSVDQAPGVASSVLAKSAVMVGKSAGVLAGIAAAVTFPVLIPVGAVALTGGLIFHKMVSRSQTAHPLRYSPLIVQSKPMVGGMPARRISPSFIQSIIGGTISWFKEMEDTTPLYLDELANTFSPNNWLGNSVGTFNFFSS